MENFEDEVQAPPDWWPGDVEAIVLSWDPEAGEVDIQLESMRPQTCGSLINKIVPARAVKAFVSKLPADLVRGELEQEKAELLERLEEIEEELA